MCQIFYKAVTCAKSFTSKQNIYLSCLMRAFLSLMRAFLSLILTHYGINHIPFALGNIGMYQFVSDAPKENFYFTPWLFSRLSGNLVFLNLDNNIVFLCSWYLISFVFRICGAFENPRDSQNFSLVFGAFVTFIFRRSVYIREFLQKAM